MIQSKCARNLALYMAVKSGRGRMVKYDQISAGAGHDIQCAGHVWCGYRLKYQKSVSHAWRWSIIRWLSQRFCVWQRDGRRCLWWRVCRPSAILYCITWNSPYIERGRRHQHLCHYSNSIICHQPLHCCTLSIMHWSSVRSWASEQIIQIIFGLWVHYLLFKMYKCF